MNNSATATIKLPVRSKLGKGIQIGVRCPLGILDEIDRWAAAQPDKPKRAEAILRLVQEALADSADKQLKMPSGSLTNSPDEEAGPTQHEAAHHLKDEVEQTTQDVRWTPRVIEAAAPPPGIETKSSPAVTGARTPVVPTRKAQPAAKPIEDNKPYEMPEDIGAFNEFWKRAEERLRRPLQYEEVVVSYNRYLHGISELEQYEE